MSIETSPAGFVGIHNDFAETELGRTLAGNIRYEKYRPEGVTNERWEQLLGADVNNLDHLLLTHGLTRSMIRHLRIRQPGYLSRHEEEVLEVTALIHDWQEGIIGDTNYNDKTPESEAEEVSVLAAIIEDRYGADDTGIKGLFAEAVEVVRDPTTKLGLVFNTIERVGYLRTGLRSAKHVAEGTSPDCEEGLRWLSADVLTNQIELLIARAKLFPPVRLYLASQADSINAAFGIVNIDVFSNYSPDQRDNRLDAFQASYIAWSGWR